MRPRLRGEMLGLERARSGQQLVGHDRERVAVRRGRRRLAHRLFGGQIRRRAQDLAGGRELVLPGQTGDPEVGHGEPVVLVEQQVAGLDVAVHDAGVVRGVERRGSLAQPAQCGCMRNLTVRLQTVAQRAPAHDLHHHEDAVLVLADVVDGDHVRVRREPGGSACFALETAARALVLAQVRSQHLDRDVAAQQLIVRLPDARHPAVGEMTNDAVAVGQGDAFRCHRGHRTHGTHRRGSYTPRRDGPNLSLMRKASRLRAESLALDGCDQASL